MKERVDNEFNNSNDTSEDNTLGRRTYLKLAGTVATLATAATGQSSAEHTKNYGYGEGGYGNGPYGGVSDFSVHTQASSSIATTSATLNGSLEYLDNAESAACSFEWRRSGATIWNTTASQQRTSVGGFSAGISGLADGVEYEYRAVGTASDEDNDVGTITRFTTKISNEGPMIKSYSVTEADSPNPHIEISVNWSVSDADGNLNRVAVKMINSAGSLDDIVVTNVSGSVANGTSKLYVKHVNGQTYDIVLTVIDTYGRDNSEVKSITE